LENAAQSTIRIPAIRQAAMINPLQHDLDHVLSHTGGVWKQLAGAEIFITGGTGFFGCWMLETLLWANRRLGLGASATVLTRHPTAFAQKAPRLARDPAVQVLEGDVRSFTFPQRDVSHVLHLAADTDARRQIEDPMGMLDTIVLGTRRVLDLAVARQATACLIASSGAVYGVQPDDLEYIPETFCGGPDPTLTKGAYGEAKRMAELTACLYVERKRLAVKIARCFAFVGPYMPLDQHFAIGNFIGDAIRHDPILVRGDGTSLRSYLYAADLAAWLWTILVEAEPGRAYNVGSQEPVSIKQLAEVVSQTLSVHTGVRILGKAEPGRAPPRYVPSVARARAELGLEQWIGLEESIRRTAGWRNAAG
jgi:nucleoside-diphosphate-sugar epimerase